MALGIVILVVIVGAAYELYRQSTTLTADTADQGSSDDAPPPTFVQDFENKLSLSDITFDPSTWPTGDRIWDVARAIGMAEGADQEGSNPDRLNNPGDISDGASTYGSEQHSGSNVTNFPDKHTGWTWLYNKLENIAAGKSKVYSPDWTWTQFAQKWAGDWQNWVNNVTQQLGVDASSTFREYVES